VVPEMVWHPGLDSQGRLDGCKVLGLDDKTSLDQGHQLVLAIDIFPSQVVADDDCQVTLVVAWDGNGAVAEAHHVTFLAVTLSHIAPLLLRHIQVGHGLYLALSCYGWDGETQAHAAYLGQDLAVCTGHCPPAVEFQSYLASGEYCVAPAVETGSSFQEVACPQFEPRVGCSYLAFSFSFLLLHQSELV